MPPVARLFLQSLPSVFNARRGSCLLQISESFVADKDGNLLDLRATIGHFLEYDGEPHPRVRAICCTVSGRCDGKAWTHDSYMLAAYEALGKLSPSFRPVADGPGVSLISAWRRRRARG
jgi:hypothetical protein